MRYSELNEQEISCQCGFDHSSMTVDENAARNMAYDLQQNYDRFNAQYFDNALPRIPLKWGALRGKTGVVKYKVTPGPNSSGRPRGKGIRKDYTGYVLLPDSLNMTISSAFLRDSSTLDVVLLHEMIHVYMASNGFIEEDHGSRFEKMRRELSQRTGMDIPLTDNTTDEIENPDNRVKELLVVLMHKNDGSHSYAIMNKASTFNEATLMDLSLFMARWAKSIDATVSIYLTSDPMWNGLLLKGMKEQRKAVKTLYRFIPGTEDAMVAALQNGQHIIDLPLKPKP